MKQTIAKIKALVAKYSHAWILLYGVVYCVWFFYLEKTINTGTKFHIMHSVYDDKIPFNEYFIVPYLLWFVYVAAAVMYFFFVNKDDYFRLCEFLFAGMTISLIICSFYPNGTDLRPVFYHDKNVFTRIVAMLYKTDTCTNVFPSIHVFNSLGVHIAIQKSRNISRMKHGTLVKAGSFCLMVSIIMATVFLKQHSVLDVCGAFILASIMYGVVYGYPVLDASAQASRNRHAKRETEKSRVNNRLDR